MFTKTNLSLLFWAVVIAAVFLAILVPATAADASVAKDRTPVCQYEDGSGQKRCVWHAESMGNGKGRSFIAKHGGTDRAEYIYISHKRAHVLATTSK